MPLTKLQFTPGIVKETTSYSNEGGWFDCDKVRFRQGFPEKIGGWTKISNSQFLGTARALHPWVALDGSAFLGVGTNVKYYIEEGGGYSDINPVRAIFCSVDLSNNGTSASGVVGNVNSIELEINAGFSATGRVGSVGALESDMIATGVVEAVTVTIVNGGNTSVNV